MGSKRESTREAHTTVLSPADMVDKSIIRDTEVRDTIRDMEVKDTTRDMEVRDITDTMRDTVERDITRDTAETTRDTEDTMDTMSRSNIMESTDTIREDTSPISQLPSTGERRVPSPQSRTRDNADPAGPSPLP